jgi:hypothetical protein
MKTREHEPNIYDILGYLLLRFISNLAIYLDWGCNGAMSGWMDGWMDGRTGGWTDGRMDEWLVPLPDAWAMAPVPTPGVWE